MNAENFAEMRPNFTRSPEQFSQTQLQWYGLCVNCMKELNVMKCWIKWFDHDYSDIIVYLEPEGEAAGVVSLLNEEEQRGLIINLLNIDCESGIFGSYLDVFGASTPHPILFLTISCVPTQEAMSTTRNLLDKWLQNRATKESMDTQLLHGA